MDTLTCIAQRASVREYSNKPVKKEILEKLVDAGRRAPTARGIEPWDFVVITEKSALEKLALLMPNGAFLKSAAACIIVLCQETKYYLEDGSAATENILLAASACGLGACWVAGDKKEYAGEVLKHSGAPSSMKLVSLISIGWPLNKKNQSKKRTLPEVLHWERF